MRFMTCCGKRLKIQKNSKGKSKIPGVLWARIHKGSNCILQDGMAFCHTVLLFSLRLSAYFRFVLVFRRSSKYMYAIYPHKRNSHGSDKSS